jgi:acetyltransferase-like isoleucine patch superfamily enzyme
MLRADSLLKPPSRAADTVLRMAEPGILTIVRRVALNALANVCPSTAARAEIFRRFGVKVGRDVFIGEGVLFDKLIEIGDRTAIGARTIITAHQVIPTPTTLRRLYPERQLATVIEHDVWIMPAVIITPGVRSGHHSVIATGAIVHKSVPPFSLVVGAAGRVAKQLDPAIGDEDV